MLEIPLEVTRRNHSYRILVGKFPGQELYGEIERRVPADSYVAVVDSRVFDLHFSGKKMNPQWRLYRIEAGEEHKTANDFVALVEQILRDGIDRKTVVVAIGGGVVGDMAGFAAATLLRGIRLVQIPTTLLAQVDSSVGGKTGINMAGGKNLLGAFYQPELVVIDPEFLMTLTRREYLAGLAEVVKYGVIADRDFFTKLIGLSDAILRRDAGTLSEIIAHCCRMKAEIVGADERESDRRQLLNLGHTFGHALEALAGYDGSLLHGEAVSVGTVMAAYFSVGEGIMPENEAEVLRNGFAALGLPCDIKGLAFDAEKQADMSRLIRSERLEAALGMDKKAGAEGLTLIVPEQIGQCRISRGVPVSGVAGFMRSATVL